MIGRSRDDEHNLDIFDSSAVVASYESDEALFPCEEALFAVFVEPGAAVLDVGVGTGRTTPWLSARAGRYAAIDYAPRMVEAVRERFADVDVRVADAAALSAFDDGTFDVAVFSFNGIDYLHPLEKRAACLRELARVVKPGGVVLLSTHNARALLRLPGRGPRPVAGSRGRRAAIAAVATAGLWRRSLASQSFWRGFGYRRDTAKGLVTFATTLRHARRAGERAGLQLRAVVAAEHPRTPRWWLTPWHYLAFEVAP